MEPPSQHTILILQTPPSALCGIDLISFTTSPQFRGIKGLPSGWHFIFTSSTASLSARHGTWVRAEPRSSGSGDVIVKNWDQEREELVDERDQAEVLRLKANLGSLWNKHLTPYRQSASETTNGGGKQDWEYLTNCLTEPLLSRVTGGNWNNWSLTTASSAKQDIDRIPGFEEDSMTNHGEKELQFLPIDLRRTWRYGAVGRERTDAAKDRSWALRDLIQNFCSDGKENEILGELQLTFLATLTLGNYSCMEQWKRILNLVLTCQVAVRERPEFFVRFLGLLKLQLQHCNDVEGGLFDLADQGVSLLNKLLKGFRRGLEDLFGDHDSPVKNEYAELESFMKTEFGWQLDDSYVRSGKLQLEDGEEVEMDINDLEGEDERGEYAPVVVTFDDGSASTT